MTLGARLYADDKKRLFTGMPENEFVWKFGEPRYIPPEKPVSEEEKKDKNLATPAKSETASGEMLRVAVGTILGSAVLLTF